jgi:hypothetical protein
MDSTHDTTARVEDEIKRYLRSHIVAAGQPFVISRTSHSMRSFPQNRFPR